MGIFEQIEKLFGSDTPTGTAIAELNRGNRGNVKQGVRNLISFYRASPWLRAVVSKISFKVATAGMQVFAVTSERQPRSSMSFRELWSDASRDLRFVRHTPLQTAQGESRQKLMTKLHAEGRL